MTFYLITGTSSGIGQGLVKLLSEQENNKILGISRRNPGNFKHYTHQTLDLNNLEAVESFKFPQPEKADKIVLINNAGTIGSIAPVGKNNVSEIIRTYNINTTAVSILMNTFINQYQNLQAQKIIINISSGAARHSIPSWSAYCASKAAVDMYSRVVNDEQQIHAPENPVRIFSVAPGIVDSEMQDQIRTTPKEDFNDIDRFISYKQNNALDTPENVARMLLKIVNKSNDIPAVILDVRQLDL